MKEEIVIGTQQNTDQSLDNPGSQSTKRWLYIIALLILLVLICLFGIHTCNKLQWNLVVYEENSLYDYEYIHVDLNLDAIKKTATPISLERDRVTVSDSVLSEDYSGNIEEFVGDSDEEKAEIDSEEELWWEVQNTKSKSVYINFLDQYPKGRYASEAKSKIRQIENRERAEADRQSEDVAIREAEEDLRHQEMRKNLAALAAEEIASNMVRIPGGSFRMGCTIEQGEDCWENERPEHRVTVSTFYINKYQITQAQWRAIMGSDPIELHNKACDLCPVEGVNWMDVQEFISELNRFTGSNYRLPTEAEWEYAARGGENYTYSGSNNIMTIAWYRDNSGGRTHPVGSKAPNKFGLYDMTGNVFEWCNDWFGNYFSGSKTDPMGPTSGTTRVVRGGSYHSVTQDCRVSFRGYRAPWMRNVHLGFRLAL